MRYVFFYLYNICDFIFLAWLYPTESTVFLNIFIPRVLLLGGAGLIALGMLIGILGLCNSASCPVRTEGVLDILGGGKKYLLSNKKQIESLNGCRQKPWLVSLSLHCFVLV